MTRYGNPWTYVLRDVLYEASNITTAIDILQKAHRTCAIHLGLSSVDDHTFRMLEYSYKTLNVYDDKNYTYTKEHPQKAGIAFFDKHVQPSKDTCVYDLLSKVMVWLFSKISMDIGMLIHFGELSETVTRQEIPNSWSSTWRNSKLILLTVNTLQENLLTLEDHSIFPTQNSFKDSDLS